MQIFKVEGMSCAHCERAVTAAIQSVDAGAAVRVDLPGGLVSTESGADPQKLVAAIEAEGYQASPA